MKRKECGCEEKNKGGLGKARMKRKESGGEEKNDKGGREGVQVEKNVLKGWEGEKEGE